MIFSLFELFIRHFKESCLGYKHIILPTHLLHFIVNIFNTSYLNQFFMIRIYSELRNNLIAIRRDILSILSWLLFNRTISNGGFIPHWEGFPRLILYSLQLEAHSDRDCIQPRSDFVVFAFSNRYHTREFFIVRCFLA